MTDVLERRFQAVANSDDDSSWDEVRSRAGRRPVGRVALLAAAAVAVVAVAAPASGLHEPVIDFFAGEPAPERIAEHYADLNRRSADWAPHIRFDVIASETRRVATVHLSDGAHTLYVAPTREGGFCFMWTEMIGSCDRLGSMPLNMGWGGGPPTVSGTVDAEWVHTVEVRFVDGRVETPKITWVSDPIGAGFFVHEVADIDDVVSVSVLDQEGRVLTEQRMRHRKPLVAPQPEALVDQKRLAFETKVDGDRMTVWTAPSNTEGRCAWLEFRGRAAQVHSCRARGYAAEVVSAAVVHFAGARFLLGQAPPQAASVDVIFEDGHSTTVSPAQGVTLLPLEADDVPARVQGHDADGRDVFSIPLMPKPLELGG
jgi:hypothetical protein